MLHCNKISNIHLLSLYLVFNVVMDDSEISVLDSIRFFEKNLDFELQAIFTAYKGIK